VCHWAQSGAASTCQLPSVRRHCSGPNASPMQRNKCATFSPASPKRQNEWPPIFPHNSQSQPPPTPTPTSPTTLSNNCDSRHPCQLLQLADLIPQLLANWHTTWPAPSSGRRTRQTDQMTNITHWACVSAERLCLLVRANGVRAVPRPK